MTWFSDTDKMGVLRFQDLPENIQEDFVRCFERSQAPNWDIPGMTKDTLCHWYANRALLKFWVNLKHLRESNKEPQDIPKTAAKNPTLWYATNLFFKSVHKQDDGKSDLWEERIYLFAAESEEQVKQRAETIGKQEEDGFRTINGGETEWKFVCIGKVYALSGERPVDGAEVFSRFLRASEAESILKPLDD